MALKIDGWLAGPRSTWSLHAKIGLIPIEMANRDPKDIAKRAIVLNCIVASTFEVPKPKLIEWLEKEGLLPYVTEWESRFLSAKRTTKDENNSANQSAEALATLLWALNRIDALPSEDEPTSMEQIVAALPKLFTSTKQFIDHAELRAEKELNEFNETIYKIHWALRDAYLNGKDLSEEYHPVVVFERHRASNWLCTNVHGETNWDDVTTDT